MNLSRAWVDYLSRSGFEASHWLDLGAPDAKDSEILTYASATDHTILTFDLDFGSLLASGSNTEPSVVILRSLDARPDHAGQAVVSALKACAQLLPAGALVIVDRSRMRVRLLPLTRL